MDFALASSELIRIGAFCSQRNWVPATAGNFSIRTSPTDITITVSGRDKGSLTDADVMLVDRSGRARDPRKTPSAETLLHTAVYDCFPDVGAVLHTHSINSVLLSRRHVGSGALLIHGFELLKVLDGQTTHLAEIVLPIFPNSQDMVALGQAVRERLRNPVGPAYGFLVAGHGLYTWGKSADVALRHAEALETLFEYLWREASLSTQPC